MHKNNNKKSFVLKKKFISFSPICSFQNKKHAQNQHMLELEGEINKGKKRLKKNEEK